MTGDNGLLQKATNAKQANEEAIALEKIQAEVAGSYGVDGKLDKEQLNKNLSKIDGLKYNGNNIIPDNIDYTISLFPATVELDEYFFNIYESGKVEKKTPIIGEVTKDNYGDYLDLGQSVVGDENSTIDDWRILYNDKNGNIYAILADYLPNSNDAVTSAGLKKVWDRKYSVKSTTSRQDLIDKLNNTTAWQSLIPEGLRQKCQVKGAPPAETILNSYNEKYSLNQKKPLEFTTYFYINNDSSKGIDTLYMPHPDSNDYEGCAGYWLSKFFPHDSVSLWLISKEGHVSADGYRN